MSENSLFDPIPTNLGELNNLEHINLQNNFLAGQVPSELGNLAFVKQLILSQNFISGTLPAEIGNMLSLEVLNLEGRLVGMQAATDNIGGPIPTSLGQLVFLSKFLQGHCFKQGVPWLNVCLFFSCRRNEAGATAFYWPNPNRNC